MADANPANPQALKASAGDMSSPAVTNGAPHSPPPPVNGITDNKYVDNNKHRQPEQHEKQDTTTETKDADNNPVETNRIDNTQTDNKMAGDTQKTPEKSAKSDKDGKVERESPHGKSPKSPYEGQQLTEAEKRAAESARWRPRMFDAQKIREREEKVRIARERQAAERQRKLVDLQESQRRAQEFREKQQEERKRKLLQMRKREEEHRALVEERRKKFIEEENPVYRCWRWMERRHAILRKSAERDTKPERRRLPAAGQQRTPPIMRRPRSSLSDHTMSSSEVSPIRKPRPHSIAGRLPNYACPTVSSQARLGRDPEKKTTASSVSNLKNRSKSADTTMRKSHSDLRKTIERLSAPKVLPIPKDLPNKSLRDSPKSQLSPAKPTPPKMPIASRVVPRDTPTRPATAKPAVTPTKGPVRADHNVANISAHKQPKAPTPKESSPVKEKSPAVDSPPKVASPSHKPATPSQPKNTRPPSPKTKKDVRPPSPAQKKEAARPPSPAQRPAKAEKSDKSEKSEKSDSGPSTPAKSAAPAANGTTAPAAPSTPAPAAKKQEEEEFKAKLAEKRRQAREEAERKAEEERLRIEKEKREEEERLRKEEEEEQRRMEEELRLAAEARAAEEERLRLAIEKEEKRKREEAEREEADRKAKEEAERKAKEDAERKEKELQERLKREEEERQERKKRLEMIMKRVKTDPDKNSDSPSPTRANMSPPGEMSPSEPVAPSQVKAAEPSTEKPSGLPEPVAATTPSDKLPLDEQLEAPAAVPPPIPPVTAKIQAAVESDAAPKFKSPLLQQMLGKKARPSITKPKTAEAGSSDSSEKKSDDDSDESLREPAPVLKSAEKSVSGEHPQKEESMSEEEVEDIKDEIAHKASAALDEVPAPQQEEPKLDAEKKSAVPAAAEEIAKSAPVEEAKAALMDVSAPAPVEEPAPETPKVSLPAAAQEVAKDAAVENASQPAPVEKVSPEQISAPVSVDKSPESAAETAKPESEMKEVPPKPKTDEFVEKKEEIETKAPALLPQADNKTQEEQAGEEKVAKEEVQKEKVEVVSDTKETEKEAAKEAKKEAVETKEVEKDVLDTKEAEKETVETKEAEKGIVNSKEAEKETVDTKESKKEKVDAKDAEKESVNIKEAEKESVDTKEAKKESVPTKEAVDTKETDKEIVDTKEAEKERVNLIAAAKETVDAKEAEKESVSTKEAEKKTVEVPDAKKAEKEIKEAKADKTEIVESKPHVEKDVPDNKEAEKEKEKVEEVPLIPESITSAIPSELPPVQQAWESAQNNNPISLDEKEFLAGHHSSEESEDMSEKYEHESSECEIKNKDLLEDTGSLNSSQTSSQLGQSHGSASLNESKESAGLSLSQGSTGAADASQGSAQPESGAIDGQYNKFLNESQGSDALLDLSHGSGADVFNASHSSGADVLNASHGSGADVLASSHGSGESGLSASQHSNGVLSASHASSIPEVLNFESSGGSADLAQKDSNKLDKDVVNNAAAPTQHTPSSDEEAGVGTDEDKDIDTFDQSGVPKVGDFVSGGPKAGNLLDLSNGQGAGSLLGGPMPTLLDFEPMQPVNGLNQEVDMDIDSPAGPEVPKSDFGGNEIPAANLAANSTHLDDFMVFDNQSSLPKDAASNLLANNADLLNSNSEQTAASNSTTALKQDNIKEIISS